jgi:hypothetical protein
MTLHGQAVMHTPQPLQRSMSTTMAPLNFAILIKFLSYCLFQFFKSTKLGNFGQRAAWVLAYFL